MPTLKLTEESQKMILNYRWNGNIRQLRNVAEQLSVLEKAREIDPSILRGYLPDSGKNLPMLLSDQKKESDFSTEREILYKVLFDMKSDLNDLKKLTLELIQEENVNVQEKSQGLIEKIYGKKETESEAIPKNSLEAIPISEDSIPKEKEIQPNQEITTYDDYAEAIVEEEPQSLLEKEIEMIKSALVRNKGKRKLAADELGISERTLYRKIKQFDLHNVENS